MTEGQKKYLESLHTNKHFKELMRLTLSIREKQRKLNKKKCVSELATESIEKSEEFIQLVKKAGYDEKSDYVKREISFIKTISKYV